jgi:MFS family permease
MAPSPPRSPSAGGTSSRDALVRRNTLLLMGAQAAMLGSTAVWFSLAVVAATDLTGRDRWAGVFLAMTNLCAASSAILVGRLMDRRGRRPGLVLGHVLLGVGGGAGGLAVWAGSAWGLFLSATVFGAGMAAALLARAAAADMYPAERRGRVVGLVVSAGTLGAIGGAPLVAAIDKLAGSTTLAWATIPFFAACGVTAALALAPDPKDLAVVEEARSTDRVRRLGELLAIAPLRAAIAAIVVAQTAMVAVMGVTPVALDNEGFGATAIAVVISLHIAGMYTLGPAIGVGLDRYGRRPGLIGGAAVSAAGAVVGSFAHSITLVAIGMFLVGLGWAACYLGATAVISDLATAEERGSALGMTDLFTSLSAAAGVLASGFVLESSGLGLVGIVMACLMIPVLLLVAPLRERSPGRWAAPVAVAEEPAA